MKVGVSFIHPRGFRPSKDPRLKKKKKSFVESQESFYMKALDRLLGLGGDRDSHMIRSGLECGMDAERCDLEGRTT